MKTLVTLLVSCLLIVVLAFKFLKSEPIIDFIDSLSSAQKDKALLDLDDSKKEDWHFFPSTMFEREGIPISELNELQRGKLQSLLQSVLSKGGYEKTLEIIELENVLRSLSGDSVTRNPEKYFTTFYGNPMTDEVWSMSFEGHHISLNFTMKGEDVIASPRFFGANPARIPKGPREGDRTLAEEEDLGFALINSLDETQLNKAIFRKESFRDIVSFNLPKLDPMDPVGISYAELRGNQKKLLIQIIDQYISTMPSKQAKERKEKVMSEDLSDLYFGWVGAKELGSAHYYRIQGNTFLIEFDNSQNNANHIHTVWRDFDGDFGRDMISDHYKMAHSH